MAKIQLPRVEVRDIVMGYLTFLNKSVLRSVKASYEFNLDAEYTIGTASANSTKFRGIRHRMNIEDLL